MSDKTIVNGVSLCVLKENILKNGYSPSNGTVLDLIDKVAALEKHAARMKAHILNELLSERQSAELAYDAVTRRGHEEALRRHSLALRETQAMPFNPAAECSPTATQCPRCNNPWNGCDAARYETVRKLNAEQFAQLFRKNIETGVHFDTLVDELEAMKGGA